MMEPTAQPKEDPTLADTASVTLTIDGQTVTVPANTTILQAARGIGAKVQSMCYDERVTPFGACRVCQVEVEGLPQTVITSCNQRVAPGIVVHTQSEAALSARHTVLEAMLLHHPLDCPICDKGGECTLQDTAVDLKVTQNQFQTPMRLHRPHDYRSPLLGINPNLCIWCNKCVRICDEVMDNQALSLRGKGFNNTIGWTEAADCEYCGVCIDACPVGALGDSLFKYRARPWELASKDTLCGLCANGCTLSYSLREQEVFRVQTREGLGGEVNQGMSCAKGRFSWGYLNNAERLRQPLLRQADGQLHPVPWQTALDFIADRLQEIKARHGADAIAGIASPTLSNEDAWAMRQCFTQAIGSQRLSSGQDHYFSPAMQAMQALLGKAGAMTHPIADIRDCDTIFTLKSNLAERQPMIGLALRAAHRHHGARLVMAEALDKRIGKRAEVMLAYLPGTESVLAYGLAHLLLKQGNGHGDRTNPNNESPARRVRSLSPSSLPEGERDAVSLRDVRLKQAPDIVLDSYTPAAVSAYCGVTQTALEQAAQVLAQGRKIAIITELSMSDAGNSAELAQALAVLGLVLGVYSPNSGGLHLLPDQANAQGLWDLGWRGPALALDDASIKALLVVGEDVANTWPKTTLSDLELLVVQDSTLTDTAKRAHVVLPAAPHIEKDGSYSNAERRVQGFKALRTSPKDAKADWQIFLNLARRLGHAELIPASIPAIRKAMQLNLDTFSGGRHLFAEGMHAQVPSIPAMPTAASNQAMLLYTGGTLFHSEGLTQNAEGALRIEPQACLYLHPEDATRLGLAEDQMASANTSVGTVTLPVRLEPALRQGVAFIPAQAPGFHLRQLKNGQSQGALALHIER